MKKYPIVILLVLAAGAGGFFLGRRAGTGASPAGPASRPAGAPAAPKKKAVKWTCSMHPWIIRDKPGKCPICSMDLVPMEEGPSGGGGPRELAMSAEAAEIAGIATAPVERRAVAKEIRFYGKIDYDETRVKTLPAWIPGRIDRLFVDYTGMRVKKGDRLGLLYSPDLLEAQEELLQAARQVEEGKREKNEFLKKSSLDALESAREKLRLLGLERSQIEKIETSGRVKTRLEILAPMGGVVIRKMVKEGDYVKTGEPLFTIADLSRVWVNLHAYENDFPWIRLGLDALVRAEEALPGKEFRGKVLFVDPFLDEATRTARVRLEFPNPQGFLKPGMYVRARVFSPLPAEGEPPLVVPATAVLLTGRRALVYVKKPGEGDPVFEGREIRVGPRAGDYYVVLSGLSEGERVVVEGEFWIDSALQLKAKPSMMSPRRKKEAAGGRKKGVPPEFSARVGDLLERYFSLEDALAADDFSTAKKALERMKKILSSMKGKALQFKDRPLWTRERKLLLEALEKASSAPGLKGLRAVFAPLSDLVSQVVRNWGTGGKAKVYRIFCPMAFGGKGAFWLQPDDQVRNPYFGPKMLKCGEVKETFSSKGGEER
ncbi:MAG TPA: efflux RND transporter periplasmic adaptor subunit [Planctomycetes bacterium]|nr:efflux RND transporter periplasmic adaptor subunit [Planctomycetota bacterium]